MPLRECLACQGLHRGPGPRCGPCTTQQERARDAARGTTTQRGLGWSHQQAARIVLANADRCAVCGGAPTEDNPLTAGHIIARADGGTNDPSNYRAECRTCNYGRRAERRR
ncbi:HNH endonuclease signature motif containing protein [Micrococcus luteus]|uniref:HNH endonuclease signature motif containing protein n=1 Tax=Micrococcus luteus TaxID=1270 RepID=UPI0033292887